MPSNPVSELSSLLRSSTITDHEQVLRAATAAIKANKADINSHHTRVVALLNLDRFDDVLRALDEGGDKLEQQCVKEKAYALYKLGRLDEATSVLQTAGLGDKSLQHLSAQVAYRAERFHEAQEMYQKLLGEEAGSEVNDLTINAKASAAQREWQGTSQPALNGEQPDTFELCYNVACSLVAKGDFDAASNLLQRAARLCDGSDDLDPEEKQLEMQPILAQQAYVYARLGKLKESLDLYNSLSQAGPSDPDLKLVLENNRTALGDKIQDDGKLKNPYLVQRQVASWSGNKDAKLFKNQSDLLRRNLLVIDLNANKTEGICRRTVKAINETTGPSTQASLVALSVLNAAAETHSKTGKELLRLLNRLLEERPEDVGLILTIVQVHVQRGRKGAASDALKRFLAHLEESEEAKFKDARFSPGLVALNVSLMRDQKAEGLCKTELRKAATYWQSRPVSNASSLLLEAGIELLRSSNSDDLQLAGATFEKLFSEHYGSHIAAAGLVASLAPSDPEKAKQYIGELPEVPSLTQGVDVEALLNNGVVTHRSTTAATKRPAPTTEDAAKPPRKKPRGKLPKDFDPNKTPDPERWLPMRDRSYYRPKGKKGKKKAADNTQGGVVKEEEMLDLVGGGGVKVEKAPTSSGGGNKKKRKGKK